MLAGLDAGEAERALDRLRATLAAHQAAGGVLFDARSWIIAAGAADDSARCPVLFALGRWNMRRRDGKCTYLLAR